MLHISLFIGLGKKSGFYTCVGGNIYDYYVQKLKLIQYSLIYVHRHFILIRILQNGI